MTGENKEWRNKEQPVGKKKTAGGRQRKRESGTGQKSKQNFANVPLLLKTRFKKKSSPRASKRKNGGRAEKKPNG